MVMDTFLPLARRHMIRPSDVQVAVTLFRVLALLSNSLRHLVRFSVMRSFVPFRCCFPKNTLLYLVAREFHNLLSLQTFRAGDIDRCSRICSEYQVCC